MIREITINDNDIDQLESLVKNSFSYDLKEDLNLLKYCLLLYFDFLLMNFH